eukprot:2997189-Pyramimonas_sp.AAC.1
MNRPEKDAGYPICTIQCAFHRPSLPRQGGWRGAAKETLGGADGWLEYALSAEFTFAKLESMGDAHFSAVRSRENLSVHKRLMGRTALGRILEVSSFKSRKEKLLGPMSSKAIEI